MTDKPSSTDLDAFLRESLGVKQRFTLFGREWTLRPELSLATRLKIEAAQADDYIETTEAELEILRSMMDPPGQVDDLIAMGMGMRSFTLLLKIGLLVGSGMTVENALEIVREEERTNQADDGDPKEATSSSAGSSSKQTFKQSTTSTFLEQ